MNKISPQAIVCLLVAATLSGFAGLVGCRATSGSGATVTVGSANTPEQILLGKMTILALRESGFRVIDQTNLGDAVSVRSALENGAIDIWWEYTGDTWLLHLHHDRPIADAEETFTRVREEDRYNGITWVAMAPCQHTMGLAMRRNMAQEHRLTNISGLARHINQRDRDVRLCAPEQLVDAASGIRGLQRVYGFRFNPELIRLMSVPEGYQALVDGECDVALAFSTDGRIAAERLVFLTDDLGFFQASNLAVAVRTPVLETYPALEFHLREISRRLTQPAIIELNRQVAVRGTRSEVVARRFLRDQGLIKRTWPR